jgi:hypothetical protein
MYLTDYNGLSEWSKFAKCGNSVISSPPLHLINETLTSTHEPDRMLPPHTRARTHTHTHSLSLPNHLWVGKRNIVTASSLLSIWKLLMRSDQCPHQLQPHSFSFATATGLKVRKVCGCRFVRDLCVPVNTQPNEQTIMGRSTPREYSKLFISEKCHFIQICRIWSSHSGGYE